MEFESNVTMIEALSFIHIIIIKFSFAKNSFNYNDLINIIKFTLKKTICKNIFNHFFSDNNNAKYKIEVSKFCL